MNATASTMMKTMTFRTKVPHCHFLIRNFSGKSFDLMSAEMSELIDLLTDDIKSCGVNYLELVEKIEEDEVK